MPDHMTGLVIPPRFVRVKGVLIDVCVRCGHPITGPFSETMMGRVHGAIFNECPPAKDDDQAEPTQ